MAAEEVVHKLAGVSVRCRSCSALLPFHFVEEKKSCSCGKLVELPKEHKDYYLDKFKKVGHT